MPRKKRSASPFELIMDDEFDDTSSQSSRNGNPPIQRNAANARERARMRVLSSAFGRLKTKLPNIPADTKLSKLDTLRLATMYIKQLKSVVEGGSPQLVNVNGDSVEESSINNSCSNLTNCFINLNSGPQSMNWPFGFHHHHHHPFQHLSNSLSASRSNTSSTISSISNTNSAINWCKNKYCNNNTEQVKLLRYNNCDNYPPQSEQQKQEQYQGHAYMQHSVVMDHENSNHHSQQQQDDHWYSETPSPELNTSLSFTFENAQLLRQQQQHQHHHHQHQQHHHDVLTHIEPAFLHSSSTYHLQNDFHNHQHQRHQHPNEQHHQQSIIS